MTEGYPTYMQSTLWTLAIQVDFETLRICYEIWKEELPPLLSEVEELEAQLPVHYVPEGMIEATMCNGRGVLGLSGTKPFPLFNAEPLWDHARDSRKVHAAINRAFRRMSTKARSRGTGHPYLYSNYASEFQEPMGSYGEGAGNFLRDVSSRYDPQAAFQSLLGAGFLEI